LLLVAKRAFVITRGLWQNMKDLESSFLADLCSAQTPKQSARVVKQKYIKI